MSVDLSAELLRPLLRGAGQAAADAVFKAPPPPAPVQQLPQPSKAALHPALMPPAAAPVSAQQLVAVSASTQQLVAAPMSAQQLVAVPGQPPALAWISANKGLILGVALLAGIGLLLWRFMDPLSQAARGARQERERERSDQLRREVLRPVRQVAPFQPRPYGRLRQERRERRDSVHDDD